MGHPYFSFPGLWLDLVPSAVACCPQCLSLLQQRTVLTQCPCLNMFASSAAPQHAHTHAHTSSSSFLPSSANSLALLPVTQPQNLSTNCHLTPLNRPRAGPRRTLVGHLPHAFMSFHSVWLFQSSGVHRVSLRQCSGLQISLLSAPGLPHPDLSALNPQSPPQKARVPSPGPSLASHCCIWLFCNLWGRRGNSAWHVG